MAGTQGLTTTTSLDVNQSQSISLSQTDEASTSENASGNSITGINSGTSNESSTVSLWSTVEIRGRTSFATTPPTSRADDASAQDAYAHALDAEQAAEQNTAVADEESAVELEAQADADRQNTEAQGDVAFATATYHQTTVEWNNLVSTIDTPWTEFKAGLAAAEETWYSGFSGTYLGMVSSEATAETTYADDNGAEYVSQMGLVIGYQQDEADKQADADATQSTDEASTQELFEQAMATGWQNFQTQTFTGGATAAAAGPGYLGAVGLAQAGLDGAKKRCQEPLY